MCVPLTGMEVHKNHKFEIHTKSAKKKQPPLFQKLYQTPL